VPEAAASSTAATAADTVVARVVALAGLLRAGGVRVGAGETAMGLRALAAVDGGSREQARLALRAVLCSRHADLAAFDAAFDAVFGAPAAGALPAPLDLGEGAKAALPRFASPDPPRAGRSVEEPVTLPAAYSDVELLRHKDFAVYTDAERALAHALLVRLARRGPRRLGRRTRLVRRGGTRADVRATLRTAVRHGGEPIELRRRGRIDTARRVVLVLDVSGSMAPYARMLLQYAQASVAARARVEAFAFGTRLTRLTLELRGRDPDAALARAGAAVDDWSGGTRIGAAIAELNRVHGRRLGRGAVVVILSDGWDRGDPELLGAEMARLRRSAYRVIWLNPLRATAGYEPLARGMAAALPHTDHFLAGHALASLDELADLLERGIR
jgi:uncharacterized protein with von Willebrand factor type A (vWA) domain